MSCAKPRWRTASECAICGHGFVKVRGSADSRSKDHIIPQSWGGPNVDWNYRATHVRCNGSRGLRITEGDIQDLAHNLFWVVAPSYTEQDRLDMARQTVEAYRRWNELLRLARHNVRPIKPDEIPDIVRKLKKGKFPWAMAYGTEQ